MAAPAYKRLQNDERRRLLLEHATALFAERGYDGLSMSQLARQAKISKALLYHYFPSKRLLFEAALADAAEDLRVRTEPDPTLPPAEQLSAALNAYLQWVQERPAAYVKLIQSTGSAEIRDLVANIRSTTVQRIREGLGAAGQRPVTRAALAGWLAFLDGAILDWIAHDDLTREELHGMLLGTFVGALMASGAGDALAPPAQ